MKGGLFRSGMGVDVFHSGSKGRLEGCELWDNTGGGVSVRMGGDPTLVGCTLRDHAVGGKEISSGCGLFVASDAVGLATAADCVFARNAKGDVVRQEEGGAQPEPSSFSQGGLFGS